VFVIAIGRFGLLGLSAARKGSDFLCKTQHRLRKKDEHGANAQCEESIFAGQYHRLALIETISVVNLDRQMATTADTPKLSTFDDEAVG
jgi:hypothetical protein